MTFTLLLGGARSGKSTMALELVRKRAHPVTFIATATAGDPDMADRIHRHQSERPPEWNTIEAPIELAAAVGAAPSTDTLIVDCLTMWVANLLLSNTVVPVDELVSALARRRGETIVVSNEVGMGVVPPTEMGRDYRDVLGRVNRTVSLAADRAVLLVAGRLLELDPPEGPR